MMNDNKRDSQEMSARLAEAVMWLVFAFIGIIALAVAIRIGLWILGAAV